LCAKSLAETVKLCGPTVLVSSGVPDGAGAEQEAIPEPPLSLHE
jgi:hypothetical protein